MKSIIDWFLESNRWKHFVGGSIIGLFAGSLYCAAYSGLIAASALEFKDTQWGGKWDWIDWGCTVAGTAVGFGLFLLIKSIFGL